MKPQRLWHGEVRFIQLQLPISRARQRQSHRGTQPHNLPRFTTYTQHHQAMCTVSRLCISRTISSAWTTSREALGTNRRTTGNFTIQAWIPCPLPTTQHTRATPRIMGCQDEHPPPRFRSLPSWSMIHRRCATSPNTYFTLLHTPAATGQPMALLTALHNINITALGLALTTDAWVTLVARLDCNLSDSMLRMEQQASSPKNGILAFLSRH